MSNVMADSLQYKGSAITGLEISFNSQDEISNIIESVSIEGRDFYTNSTFTDGIKIGRAEWDEEIITGVFDVTYAGNYTVTIKLLDSAKLNYEFANSSNDTVELSFAISQRPVEGTTSLYDNGVKTTEISYSPALTVEDILGKLQFAPIEDSSNNNNQSNKYNLQYALFVDQNYTTQATKDDIQVGKTLYAKAIDVLPYSAGDNAYLDYRLPTNNSEGLDGICCSVTLAGPKLARPSITPYYYTLHPTIDFTQEWTEIKFDSDNGTISAFYLGFGYKISQWFYTDKGHDKWNDSVADDGHEGGDNWNVTVNGKEEDPNTYEMKNVGTYNIRIEAKDGYQFMGGQSSYEMKLTIKPYVLASENIKWIDNKHEYSGEPIYIGENDYEVVNLWGDDELSLLFELDNGGTALVDGKPINAGRYIYKIVGIVENEYSSNYYIETGDNALTNSLSPFTIYKKRLDDFKTDGPLVKGVFTGQEQQIDLAQSLIDLGLASYTMDGGTEVLSPIIRGGLIKRSYPDSWNLGNATLSCEASFNLIDTHEYFNFKDAGSYSVVFEFHTLAFMLNYCWFEDSNVPTSGDDTHNTTYEWTNFALIERVEVDPLLEPINILTNYDGDYDIDKMIADKFKGLGDVYTLAFGKDGQTGTSATALHGTANNYVEGNYYVLININEDVYPNVYFKAAQDDEYTVNGRQARIDYSVTSSTVSITCNVKESYTFGDNFNSAFNVVTVNTKSAEGN